MPKLKTVIAFLSGFEGENEQERVDNLNSVDFQFEVIHPCNEAEDRTCPKVNHWNAPIPADVKEAIKSMYAGGITKPQEIMKSLGESGVVEEGSFRIGQLYNCLKNMKKQMGVKKRSRGAIGGLEM